MLRVELSTVVKASHEACSVFFREPLNFAKIDRKVRRMKILERGANHSLVLLYGLFGGVFLQLSYFGTDQSQVQRYLTGETVEQSRLGLLFNGLIKVPMQFFILFVGATRPSSQWLATPAKLSTVASGTRESSGSG